MDKLPAFQYILPTDKGVEKNIKPGIEFELSMLEYAALGRVSIQWAFLEHVLSELYTRFCELEDIPASKNISSLSFKTRLRAFFDLIKVLEERGQPTRNLYKLHSDIAVASHERHKLIHGIWDYSHSNPFGLYLYTDREGVAFEKKEDIDGLHALSQQIGFLNMFMIEIKVDGRKISDLPRTGMVYNKEGAPIGHLHRSMQLSPENQGRLYPEFLKDRHKSNAEAEEE